MLDGQQGRAPLAALCEWPCQTKAGAGQMLRRCWRQGPSFVFFMAGKVSLPLAHFFSAQEMSGVRGPRGRKLVQFLFCVPSSYVFFLPSSLVFPCLPLSSLVLLRAFVLALRPRRDQRLIMGTQELKASHGEPGVQGKAQGSARGAVVCFHVLLCFCLALGGPWHMSELPAASCSTARLLVFFLAQIPPVHTFIAKNHTQAFVSSKHMSQRRWVR